MFVGGVTVSSLAICLDVGLDLPAVLADDLGVDNVTLVRDLGVRHSGEGS